MGRVLDLIKTRAIEDRSIQTTCFNIDARHTTVEVTKCVVRGEFPRDVPELELEPTLTVEPAPHMEPTPPIVAEVVPELGVVALEVPAVRNQSSDDCVVERQRVIQGYEVNNELSVKVRELGSIDEVTAAGGDLIRFQGIRCSIEDSTAPQDEARASAVEDLLDKAGQVATLAGVKLGRPAYIREPAGPTVTQSVRAGATLFAADSAPTPIQIVGLIVTVSLQGAFTIGTKEN